MKITISNRQKIRRTNRQKLIDLTHALMKRIEAACPDTRWQELSLILTDDQGMRDINRRAFGDARVTDVISFRFDPIPGDETEACSAEIIVNLERAWKEGQARSRWTPSKELALYLAHGCNHLTGWDDQDAAGASRMRRRELRWLRGMPLRDLLS